LKIIVHCSRPENHWVKFQTKRYDFLKHTKGCYK
jgi:hypothetical protein